MTKYIEGSDRGFENSVAPNSSAMARAASKVSNFQMQSCYGEFVIQDVAARDKLTRRRSGGTKTGETAG
jgi:hypothetical protein